MVNPVFSLFPNFKIKVGEEFVTIAALTKLNPKTTKEVNKRYRLSEMGYEVQDIYGIEKCFEIDGEVLAEGEDVGNNALVALEDAQGEAAKVEYQYTFGSTQYNGTLVVDITTQGGQSNDLITFTGTLYVYGQPTKTTIAKE